MENDDLRAYIQQCNASLQPELLLMYEASFFKIYVKFEKYLSKIFESYCIGTESSKGYCPQRKLEFADEEHLRAILKGDKQYIDYIKKIQSLSPYIFVNNPFNIIFAVAENQQIFNEMIALRNYIANESNESRKKYTETCLGNGSFIEPGEHLTRIKRRKGISYYSIYINKIIEISELILAPPDL